VRTTLAWWETKMTMDLRVEVPERHFIVGEPLRDADGTTFDFPEIVTTPELSEWCNSHGVKARLYAEEWFAIDRPDEVWLDMPDEDTQMLFLLRWGDGLKRFT
jgi:hypothetical protein